MTELKCTGLYQKELPKNDSDILAPTHRMTIFTFTREDCIEMRDIVEKIIESSGLPLFDEPVDIIEINQVPGDFWANDYVFRVIWTGRKSEEKYSALLDGISDEERESLISIRDRYRNGKRDTIKQ